MTVMIRPINARDLYDDNHYREFEDVESIEDDCFPLIKIRHKSHNCYALMKVPDNCYLLILDKHTNNMCL